MDFALITGASKGIGLCFAKTLANQYHYNLLLISYEEEDLHREAENIRMTSKVHVEEICIDLCDNNAAKKIYQYCKDKELSISVLINNAGMLIFDRLTNVDDEQVKHILELHVLTLTRLCRLFLPMMEANGKGYILNMSSMSAYTALPGIQCYNASKAYVLNFSRAMWYEAQPKVHIMALLPGATNTTLLPFPTEWAKWLKRFRIIMPPEWLVNKALKKLFNSNRKAYMPGIWNHIITPILKHLPDSIILFFTKKLLQPKN